MTEEDLTVNTLGIRMSPTNTAPLIFYYQHSTIRIRRIQAPGSGRHDKLNYRNFARGHMKRPLRGIDTNCSKKKFRGCSTQKEKLFSEQP